MLIGARLPVGVPYIRVRRRSILGYSLGIDLGTTFTAAAIDRTGHIEMATLGDRTSAIPSVVLIRADGPVLTGDAANRRAAMEPDRVAREFKRRFGDPTPLVLGGAPYSVSSVLARLLTAVVGAVAEREGGPADQVMLTHPANWGPYKRELFDSVPRLAEVERVAMITEPEAAAAHYAANERVADGAVIAVYDFGGGTFDATVLRKRATGFEILGTPEGVEGLGGIDFDEGVFAFVDRTLDGAVTALDFSDRQTAAALVRLRQECVLAKEALSVDTETTVPVLMPGLQTEVRLTRAELEEMMRPSIEATVSSLRRALRSARVEPEDLTAVLLVGGSSRIPLVSQMVSAALGRPTAVDTHPKHVIALGAAALAGATWLGAQATGARHHVAGAPPRPAVGPLRPAEAGRPAAPAPAARRPPTPASGDKQGVMPAAADGANAPSAFAADGERVVPAVDGGPAAWPPASDRRQAARTAPDAAGPATASAADTVRIAPPTSSRPTPADPSGRPDGRSPGRGPAAGAPPPPLAGPATGDGPARRRLPLLVGIAVVAVLAVVAGVLLIGRPTATPAAQPAQGGVATAVASIDTPVVTATIPVGEKPQAVVLSPDGRTAYVTNSGANSISLIDTSAGGTIATIPIPGGPPQFASITPDGAHLYVSVFGGDADMDETVNSVDVVDTASRAVTATIPVGKHPYASAVTPDGKRVFVPNHDSTNISVIDTASNKVTGTIAVKPNPHFVTFTKDGSKAFVANHESNVVSVLDTASDKVAAVIPVGRSPHSLSVSPDQKSVYVVNFDQNSVSVIDVATNAVTATVAVGAHPQSVVFAPDGRHAYVANNGDHTMSVIDTASRKVVSTIHVGQSPTTIAVAPDGRSAYVTNFDSNTVSVLRIVG
jgi:YVTN family beta-propeller protein